MRSRGGALAFVLALVLQPFVPGGSADAAAPAPMTALDPALATVKQKLWSEGEGPGFELGVLADPASGRIQVLSRRGVMEHFVHFGLGSRDEGGGCVVDRWVVLQRASGAEAQVYDAARQPVDVVQRFGGSGWEAEAWARLAIAPGGWSADCVTVFGTVAADPASTREGVERSADLELYDETVADIGGLAANLPNGIVRGEDATLRVNIDLRPWASWEDLTAPPVRVPLEITVPAESGLEVVAPASLTTIDPWVKTTAGPSLTVRTNATYWVYPEADITLGGIQFDGGIRAVPVRSPVPTDWVGTLAGTQLWTRYDEGWPPWDRHRFASFLDDEWVYISLGPGTDVTCTVPSEDRKGSGCHRYYYDEATSRLQIDDYEVEPTTDPDGWKPWWQEQSFPADSKVGTVTAGRQFDFKGAGELFTCSPRRMAARGCEHTYVKLVLRADGSYVFTRTEEYSEPIVRRGTYRFRSGQRLELHPRQGGTKTLNGVIALRQHGQLVDLEWAGGSLYGVG